VSKTLAFIGGGNMAGSMIGGLIAKGYPANNLRVSDVLEENRNRFASRGLTVSDNNLAVAAGADAVILAVKPQQLREVCTRLAPVLQEHQPLVISIAAGVEVSAICDWLEYDAAIVRCMPNTPALVQTGATGLYACAQVSDEQRSLASNIMDSIGMVLWVSTEDKLHAVTAVSGSGPAYFFLFMEAMISAAQDLGLEADAAQQLAFQTAAGAAKMALNSDVDVAELRRRVTSPGGTTERAIRVFEERGLRRITGEAMEACDRRSRELAEELK